MVNAVETVLLKAFKMALIPPHRATQLVANAGDLASGELARLYFKALKHLGEIESRGTR